MIKIKHLTESLDRKYSINESFDKKSFDDKFKEILSNRNPYDDWDESLKNYNAFKKLLEDSLNSLNKEILISKNDIYNLSKRELLEKISDAVEDRTIIFIEYECKGTSSSYTSYFYHGDGYWAWYGNMLNTVKNPDRYPRIKSIRNLMNYSNYECFKDLKYSLDHGELKSLYIYR